MNGQLSRLKRATTYENEVLPVLLHNHRLAQQEKRILYDIVTKIWRTFDEHLRNEISVQQRIEQIRKQHQYLTERKIKQEHDEASYGKMQDIRNDVLRLKRGRQQLQCMNVFRIGSFQK